MADAQSLHPDGIHGAEGWNPCDGYIQVRFIRPRSEESLAYTPRLP